MDLAAADVAKILKVSQKRVLDWAQSGKLPSYRMGSELRFDRAAVEELVFNEGSLGAKDTEAQADSRPFSLYRAINNGGVYHTIKGNTKEEIIATLTRLVAERLDTDADTLLNLLLEREALMPTALGNGIAVPHTRDFLLQNHKDAVAVVFCNPPLDYGALDGRKVHTLFFLFACDDKQHLNLLAKIAHLASNAQMTELLAARPQPTELFKALKDWEEKLG